MVQRGYKFRCYPTEKQIVMIAKIFGSCRFVYNHFLDLKTKTWKEEKRNLTYGDCSSLLTKLKKQFTWLTEVSSVPLQQTLRHLDKAFGNFFGKRSGFPKFKKKHEEQSATFAKNAFTYENGEIFLAKDDAPLKIQWSRPFTGTPSSITITKDRAGRYFVSILVEEEVSLLPPAIKRIGLDLGIANLLTDHTGKKEDSLALSEKDRKKLERKHKEVSRKIKGSANRAKARLKLAKAHAKIRDKKIDALHKKTTQLVRENQAIIVEDLSVKEMMKNKKLARRIGESSWGMFLQLLKYKCSWYGRQFVQIDRFFPSSKLCSCCRKINEGLTLQERHWECPHCKTLHDRDINAARNILLEGLRILGIPWGSGELSLWSWCKTQEFSRATGYEVESLVREG